MDSSNETQPAEQRTLAGRAALTAKGFLMGLSDVIPGVSGGTMALILGIYVQFIEGLKSLNLRFVKPLALWVFTGFKNERWQQTKAALGTIHLNFLVFLGGGIVVAFGIGSKVIPKLLDSNPVEMRAFFLGLIVASVWVPYRLLKKRGAAEVLVALSFGLAAFFLVGLSEGNMSGWDQIEVTGAGQTLEELAEEVPSALPPSQLMALEVNQRALATIIAANDVDVDVQALASSSDPRHTAVNELIVPESATIVVPRPPLGWIFLCGIIAICAMVLPGVSGSFLLLALGSYYFMLNSLKGFIHGAIHLSFGPQVPFVVVFIVGMIIGMAAFSRVLSFLFSRYQATTLAAMIGLMVGCLRAIWPFQENGDNVLPATIDGSVFVAIGLVVVGAALVVVLTLVGAKRNKGGETLGS